jgi:enoyl-CoA hydratase/carnithine racemase
MKQNPTSSPINVDRRDGILRLTLNRHEKKNALSPAMYDTLAEAIEGADRDDGVRVLLFQGAGDCFTSGNDLRDFVEAPPAGEASPVFRFLMAIHRAQKPLVAAVHGAAVGVGTTMLLHCDLVCAGKGARFQLPFVPLGLCPEAGSSLLLPRLAGYQRAAELLLLGEPFGVERAREIGLVNAVFADEELLDGAYALAGKLAQQPPAAVRLTKALLKKGVERAVTETIAEEGHLFLERLRSPEATAALAAFFQRSRPDASSETEKN